MTKQEFSEAVRIAETQGNTGLQPEDLAIFCGCAYPEFKPVYATQKLVVFWLRWEALLFSGEWDFEALNSCAHIARKKIYLVGG